MSKTNKHGLIMIGLQKVSLNSVKLKYTNDRHIIYYNLLTGDVFSEYLSPNAPCYFTNEKDQDTIVYFENFKPITVQDLADTIADRVKLHIQDLSDELLKESKITQTMLFGKTEHPDIRREIVQRHIERMQWIQYAMKKCCYGIII